MGEWSIVPSAAGTFSPREISPKGWERASANPADVVLGATEKKHGGHFGNFKQIKVCGLKFNDRNNNSVRDGGEEGLNGFTIELYDKNGNLVATTTTKDIDLNNDGSITGDEHGAFCFYDVSKGNFTIKEQAPGGGWVITAGADGYTRGTRSGEDQGDFLFGNHHSVDGRMTGGGSTFKSDGSRITHGFQVHTDLSRKSTLQVNWAKQRFHLTALTYADGQENLDIDQGKPSAPIDTFVGKGYGWYNGTDAAVS